MFLDSRVLLMGLVMGGLVACSPKTTYENFISDQGYIPFQQPLSQVGVGALLAGSPDQLRIISPSKTCFPTSYNGVNTELYQSVDAQLPEISKKMSISAGMDANFLAASGTPLFRLKTSYTQLKTLDVHIDGASIEYLDEIAFGMWVYSGMSEACRAYLQNGGSFIRQALRVDKMLFQFKNSKGGLIAINTDKIKEIMDFEVDVKWEIVDNYTMSITSPKYVGYHLAKVNPQSPGSIAYIASDLTKKGEFDFKPVQSYNSYQGMMSSY